MWGYGAAGLRALLKSANINLVKVYTKWDEHTNDIYMNQVYHLAKDYRLEVVNTSSNVCKKSDFEKKVLSNRHIDFLVSCCFDRIFTDKILEIPRIIAINVHPSILPKYRGVKPLENAIINGKKNTGVTIHELVKELDAGDIILQEGTLEIRPEDTYKELYNRQCKIIEEILLKFFEKPVYYIQNKFQQDLNKISFAPRIKMNFRDEATVQELIDSFNSLKNNE